MPNRIIKESIRTSRSINALTDFQFRLWLYLITYVDDYGRGSADPEILKGFVFPRRKRVTESDIEKTLAELAGMGCINLYNVDGESYFYFPNWGEHQRIQTKKSKFPEPSTGEDANQPYVTVNHGEQPPESNPNPNPNPKNTSYSSSNSELDDVKKLWNSLNLNEIVSIQGKRRESLNARIKDYGFDKILTAVENIKKSSFLRGQNKNNWIITFDWLIKPNNFTKVLEGNYNDDKKSYTETGEKYGENDYRGSQL